MIKEDFMNKLVATSIVLAALTASQQNAIAANTNNLQTENSTQQQAQQAWLGVSLTAVPEVLSRQLGNLIPERQGVMVQSVVPDSPAEKAGIKDFDIILSYNDQKLYSAKQLAGLVAADQANNEATLSIVQNAAKKDLKVTLGGRELNLKPLRPMQQKHPMFNNLGRSPMMPSVPPFNLSKPSGKVNSMQQFESFSIKQTGDDNYRAEVEFQENGGEKKHFTFEGKYDEVREQIKKEKGLPAEKKTSLLNALKGNPAQMMPNNLWDFPAFPAFPGTPFFDNAPANTPLWFRNGQKL
jgi:membrane-associated protease RseP (regulator of RpoE activity)